MDHCLNDTPLSQPLLHKYSDELRAQAPRQEEKATNRLWSAVTSIPRLLWDNGLFCIVVAAMLFSTMSLLVKLIGHSVPTFQVVLIRSIFSFSLTLWLLWFYGVQPVFGSPKHYPLLGLRGLLGSLGMSCSYFGIAYLPLAEAITIFFSNPALTALLEWLLTGEALGWVGSLSSLSCLLGVLLVANPPFLHGGDLSDWDRHKIMGVAFSFGGAWSVATSFMAVRFLGKSEPAMVLAMWYHLVASLTSGIPLALGFPTAAVLPDLSEWFLLLGVAFTSFLGQLLLNRGFQLESATKASAVNVTQVLFSYIWDVALFHHSLTTQVVCGSLLITAGVILISKRRRVNKANSRFVQQTLVATAQTLHPTVTTSIIPEDQPVVISTQIRRALSRNSFSMSCGSLSTFALPVSGSLPIGGASPRLMDPEGGNQSLLGESYSGMPGSLHRVSIPQRYGSVADSVLSWFEDPIDDYDRYADQLAEDDPAALYSGIVEKSMAEVMEPEAQLYHFS